MEAIKGYEGYQTLRKLFQDAGYRECESARYYSDTLFQKRVEQEGTVLYFVSANLWEFPKYGGSEYPSVMYDAYLYRGKQHFHLKFEQRDYWDIEEAEQFVRDFYERMEMTPDPYNQLVD